MKDEPPPSSTASRILSGSVGSMIYVTAFAPLEVVKIRQQAAAHSTGGPSSSSSSSLSSSWPASSSAKALLRGRGAVVLSNGLLVPTSAFPCLVAPQYRHQHARGPPSLSSPPSSRLFESDAQAASSLRPLLRRPRLGNDGGGGGGVLSALRSIARNEGAAGLYAGLRPTLLAVVPNAAVYLSAYDEISSRLRRAARLRDDDDDDRRRASSGNDDGGGCDGDRGGRHWIPFVAGASARLVSSVATAPLELVRTRQAANCPRHHHHGGSGVIGEFRLLLSASGPSGLYRGLVPMVLRDVPFSAVYFTCLEAVRSSVSTSTALGTWGARYHRERGDRPPPAVDAIEAFVGGMAAGSIATLLTTPFDVVKTRRMTASLGPVGGWDGDHRDSRGGGGGGGGGVGAAATHCSGT